jgi:hypothetical protein
MSPPLLAGDCLPNASELPPAERTVRGYKTQCELLYEYLSRLVACCEASCSSLICEGVHLSISFVMKLMQVGWGRSEALVLHLCVRCCWGSGGG